MSKSIIYSLGLHCYIYLYCLCMHCRTRRSRTVGDVRRTWWDIAPSAANRRTGRRIRVVFDSGLYALLCENLTSSTKPEVHNLLHCRQSRTEPWPQVTCIENLVIFVRVVFDIRERTDRQTNIHADHNTLQIYSRRSKYWETRESATWRQKVTVTGRRQSVTSHILQSCAICRRETEKYRIKRRAGWHGYTGPRAATITASAYSICSAYSCSVGRISV